MSAESKSHKDDDQQQDPNLTRWILERLSEMVVFSSSQSGRFIDLKEVDDLDDLILRALNYLVESGKTQTAIASWANKTQPTISRMLKKLKEGAREKKSLVSNLDFGDVHRFSNPFDDD